LFVRLVGEEGLWTDFDPFHFNRYRALWFGFVEEENIDIADKLSWRVPK